MEIRVDFKLPSRSGGNGPLMAPLDFAQRATKTAREMRVAWPRNEFWVIQRNLWTAIRKHKNLFDVKDPLGNRMEKVEALDRNAWKYLMKGTVVVIKYRRANRQSPYIDGLAPVVFQLLEMLPTFWPRTHQTASRQNAPVGVAPAALGTVETWDLSSLNGPLGALRADDLGVWAATGRRVHRFTQDTAGAWTQGDPYVPGARDGGGTWAPVGLTLLEGTGRLWLPLMALVSDDVHRSLRLVQNGEALWTVSWRAEDGEDPLRVLGELYGDALEFGGAVHQLALVSTSEGRRLTSHRMDPSTGALLGSLVLPYVQDVTSKVGTTGYTFAKDQAESAHNLDLGGSLTPRENLGRLTRAEQLTGPSETPWTLPIHGHVSVAVGDRLVCVPQVQANQIRAFDLTTGVAGVASQLWSVEPVEIPGTTDGGEYLVYLPLAGVEEASGVQAQFLFAWERRTYVHRPAFNKPSSSAIPAINAWIGTHAGIGVSYWAPNEHSFASPADWDLVMSALVAEDLVLQAPFNPSVAPNFSYPSDVTRADDPWEAAETFLLEGLDVDLPDEYLTVILALSGNYPGTYVSMGAGGVGDTLTASEPGAFDNGIDLGSEGDTYLLNGQDNPRENGVFVLTTAGDEDTPWVLTRHTDADTALKVANQFVYTVIGDQWWLSIWDGLVTGTLGTDGFGYQLYVDQQPLAPIVETAHPGTDVPARKIWTKSRYGLETRKALTGDVLRNLDLNANLLPTPRFAGTVSGPVGNPTLPDVNRVEKPAGVVIPLEEIRVTVPSDKVAGISVTVAVAKVPIQALDRSQPIEGGGYEPYVWPEQPFAWIFWHVEGINTAPRGLVPDAYQAVYYTWTWLFDKQTWQLNDACPPPWDLSMCSVDIESKTILFGPGQRIEGVLGTNPDGSANFLYGPSVATPENPKGSMSFPIPVSCKAAAFDLVTLAHRRTFTVGATVGHSIESARSECCGANPIISPKDLESSEKLGVFVAHSYGTEGNEHRSSHTTVNLATGGTVAQVSNAEVSSGSSAGAEDRGTYQTGAILTGGSLWYAHNDPGHVVRRRG